MFTLRHIAIVCKEDLELLKQFYVKLFKPLKIIIANEDGPELENITGIKDIEIITCKLFCDGINIEIIKYINPSPDKFLKTNSAFTGFNHIALNVESFSSSLKLVQKYGGHLMNKNFVFEKNKKINVAYVSDPEGNILELVKCNKNKSHNKNS